MIKGLIAPILSPFNDDLSFNQDLYNALAAELLQTGCSGLAPFGTTGEALSVGCAERIDLGIVGLAELDVTQEEHRGHARPDVVELRARDADRQ